MKSLLWLGFGITLALLAGCSDGDDEVLQTTATPEPTEIIQLTPTADGPDASPALQDQALADAFLGFVADPSVERIAVVPLAESVGLGLGEDIIKTVPAENLLDPVSWMIARDEFRGWSGPFSALFLPQSPVIITVGPHPRCVADPVPAPPSFADHRRVSLQPETATSCLEWWTIDFFVNDSGEVDAITLDLFAP